ncbi:hypothetical protein [Tenacibaculum halocynthiae]|uniref:hypothetical protein n=1 Tax=Tenacibaculum halocynthiae TaxID=1254437 RepID=UPI003894A002
MIFNLRINCSNNEVHYSLYDGYDQLKLENKNESTTIDLHKGIYFLEAELSGIVKQVKIHLDSHQSVDVPFPVYSSTPFHNALTTDEDKLSNGLQYSNNFTDRESENDSFHNGNTGLFIFLRSSDFKEQKIEYGTFKVLILNKSLKVIKILDESNSKLDEKGYWMAYSNEFEVGQYFVQIESEYGDIINPINEAWVFPIYIYPRIKANVFLTVKKVPLYRSLKIFYNNSYEDFRTENKYLISTDIALNSLTNYQFDNLPNETMNELLYGKFDQPMFGFLALYFLLLRKKKDNLELVKTIVRNMEHRILNTSQSPELDALKFMANAKYDLNFEINKQENVNVPMFNFGLDIIVNNWNKDKSLFDKDSPINDATEKLLLGTPFTIWRTFPKKENMSFSKTTVGDYKIQLLTNNKSSLFGYLENEKLNDSHLIRNIKSNNEKEIDKFYNNVRENVSISKNNFYLLMEYLYLGGRDNNLKFDLIIKKIRISPHKLNFIFYLLNHLISLPKALVENFNNQLGKIKSKEEIFRIEENIKSFIGREGVFLN